MKTLKVRLAYQAPMTGIPSAQMIFGAICHGLKAVHGQKTLESFLNSIEENPQTFAISSLFLANTLPLPLDIEPARIDDLELDRDALTTIKKLKKVRFISQPLFDLYKQDRDQFNRTFLSNWVKGTYLFNEKHMLLHGKDEHEYFSSVVVKKHVATRNKWAFKDDDKALFYTSRLVYSKGTVFEFYIYGDDENLRLIQKVFERLIYFTLGGKQSIGLNLFQYIDLKPVNPYSGSSKVLVSKAMVVAGEVDLNQSFYRTSLIESLFDNIINGKQYRKPIIAFDEGSVFQTDRFVIGTVVKTNVGMNDYQNALGMML